MYRVLLELKAKMNKMDQYIEDLEFARRTNEAYQRIEAGGGIEMEYDEFIEDMKKW